MNHAGPLRNRIILLCSIAVVIVWGLAFRKYSFLFPAMLGKYPGDALWAVMVYLGWGFVRPRASSGTLALYALTTSFAVEFSQIYQAAWMNDIRSTALGHLVLGSTFGWIDLVAYTAGVALAYAADSSFWIIRSRHTPFQP